MKAKIILLVGETNDGELYLAYSTGDEGKMLWLIERFKRELMRRYIRNRVTGA